MKRYDSVYVMRTATLDKLFDKNFERIPDALLFLEMRDVPNNVYAVMPKENYIFTTDSNDVYAFKDFELEEGKSYEMYSFYKIGVSQDGIILDEGDFPKKDYKKKWRIWNSYPTDQKRNKWVWSDENNNDAQEETVLHEVSDISNDADDTI